MNLTAILFFITIFISFLAFVLILIQNLKYRREIADRNRSLEASKRIYQIILEDLDYHTVIQKVADSIPDELMFVTGVLAVLDEERGVIKRVAASHTKEAQEAIKALSTPFEQIEISINDANNLMAKAVREKHSFITENVYDVLGPVVSKEEAMQIQNIMGTKTTLVYPILIKSKPIGVFLASTRKTKDKLSVSETDILDNFVHLVGLTLQNSLLFTSLKTTKDNLQKTTADLQLANKRLEVLDKLKDDFVSVASHELRTPMTAIRSYAWMALHKSDINLSPKLERYLSRVLSSTERLINLVNDMLNVSRIESGRIEISPQTFNLSNLASDVITEITPKAAEKNLKVKFINTEPLNAFADPDKVHQVLLNLLGNAMKFTPNGGNIEISFFADGKFIDVSIKDSGVGISKEDQSRLFQKFGRLENSYVAAAASGGTGLGLYICKNLIELMGGKIWANSEGQGRGSTFTFSLPIATQEVLANASKYSSRVQGEAKVLEPVAL